MQFETICNEFGSIAMSFESFHGVGGRIVVTDDDLEKVWGRIAFILESYLRILS